MSHYPVLNRNDILSAEILLGVPGFVSSRKRKRGAKGRGLRFEAEVNAHFRGLYPHYVASPWFVYRVRQAPRREVYAQPDGILFDPLRGVATIVEIKYQHISDAYFQLVDKYAPILDTFLDRRIWKLAFVEVCRWYDGTIPFPTQVRMRKDITRCEPNEFAVHIHSPRGI